MDSVDVASQLAAASVSLSACAERVSFSLREWRNLERMGMTSTRWNTAIDAFRRTMRTALQHRVHGLSFRFGPFDESVLMGEDRHERVLHARMLFARLTAFSNDCAALAACCFSRFDPPLCRSARAGTTPSSIQSSSRTTPTLTRQ
jgi:hypothetical protein